MILFDYNWGRVSFAECPLMSGQFALRIEESSKGKCFSEIANEIIKNPTNENVVNLMHLKFILNVVISSQPDEETLKDVTLGLTLLDNASKESRLKIAKTERELISAKARRIYANLHSKGLLNCKNFAMNFDSLNVDMSLEEDIDKKLITLVELSQRTNPTTYVIGTEFANKLESMKDTSIYKVIQDKCNLKSVFAPNRTVLEGKEISLENNFVRGFNPY